MSTYISIRHSVFDVSSVSKETLDTDVIWGTMPTYDGEVKHYEEI